MTTAEKNRKVAELTGLWPENDYVSPARLRDCYDFCGDPASAWRLLEWMPKEWVVTFYHRADQWVCQIQVPTDTWCAGIKPESDKILEGAGNNKQLALVDAFIAAMEGRK